MVYQCRTGHRIAGDANKVGHEIETLGDKVSPRAVLELARDAKTELHKNFLWDDTKAAEEYRVEQARGILQALVIVEDRPDKPYDPLVIRAYESIELPGERDEEIKRAYIPIRKALADKDMRAQIMGRLLSIVSQAQATLLSYEHLVPVFSRARKHIAVASRMLEKEAKRKPAKV